MVAVAAVIKGIEVASTVLNVAGSVKKAHDAKQNGDQSQKQQAGMNVAESVFNAAGAIAKVIPGKTGGTQA